MLSANKELKTEINQVLSEFGVFATWSIQHKHLNAVCTSTRAQVSDSEAPQLASALRAFPIWFEMEVQSAHENCRYLFVPVLGLHRQQLGQAGEVLIRHEAIEQAIYLAAGSAKELERLIRKLSGQNHIDLLDELRIDDLRTISRAV